MSSPARLVAGVCWALSRGCPARSTDCGPWCSWADTVALVVHEKQLHSSCIALRQDTSYFCVLKKRQKQLLEKVCFGSVSGDFRSSYGEGVEEQSMSVRSGGRLHGGWNV